MTTTPIQPRSVTAFTTADADSALDAFISVFWDPQLKYFYTNSDRQIHPEHAFGPMGGLYTDFWWEAQLWELVMDAYERTGSTTYLQMIDDIYDGFVAQYPTFDSDFNDDLGWWALAAARAYELTGQVRYLDRATALFESIWAFEDTRYGGGIWWKRTVNDQKNVATNAPAAITAIRLYAATNDPVYMQRAQQLFDWIDTRLVEAGHVYDHVEGGGAGTVVKWDFTYNFGTYIGAATALHDLTADPAYLSKAVAAADWTTTYLTSGGTILYEGSTHDRADDGGGFKGIFVRNLATLVEAGQTQYLAFLQQNASQAWNHRRASDALIGPDWGAPAPSTYIQSLSAASGVAALQVVAPDGGSGLVAESGSYDAENARRINIPTENIYAGYTGRGYLAGWSSSDQAVTFYVNGVDDGSYRATFRYGAGAGDASRTLVVNGQTVAANLGFANTGAWDVWSTAIVDGIPLVAGSNSLTLSIDLGNGNGNWLNLDRADLELVGGG